MVNGQHMLGVSREDITVVIPTHGRETILIETLQHVLRLDPVPKEVLLVDQTPQHEPGTAAALRKWSAARHIRWIRLSRASIPHAMNVGMIECDTPFVLYMDDDVVPRTNIIEAYSQALNDNRHSTLDLWCVAGQVLQPGEEVIDFGSWKHNWFPFNSDKQQFVSEVMAGNLCVDREKALGVGGFDENFHGSAYRFESEFARRVLGAGGRILFEPRASIRHLRAERGGTRFYGHHLRTWKPYHSVGKYYYGFRGGAWNATKTLVIQPLRAIRTKHHLRRPWWIPATLIAELLGICWACWLCARGPRLARTLHRNGSGNGEKEFKTDLGSC